MAAKLTIPQTAVFDYLSDRGNITCAEAIHVGANGRTLAAMTDKGWLVERRYANGPRTWELTALGFARKALSTSKSESGT